MKTRARVALCLLFAVTLPLPSLAQTPNKPNPRPEPPRPETGSAEPQFQPRIAGEAEVGEEAPDFELDASTGEPIRLSSRRGHWVLLAFGDRKEMVAEFRGISDSLESSGIRMIGVCNEKAYFLEAFAKETEFPFPILADVTHEISDMYGLFESHQRIVLPGFVMIDPQGIVRFALLGQSLPADDVLRLARYVSGRP